MASKSQQKSTDFYELLDAIGKRPALYLSPAQSITALFNFLAGCQYRTGYGKTDPPYREFNNWVAMRCGFYESTSGWRNMLLRTHDGDEEKAFLRFFELLDEFKSRKETVLYTAKLPKTLNRRTKIIQIIKYTEDGGVFVRFLNSRRRTIDEMYWQTLDGAFFFVKNQVGELDWQPS